MNHNFTNYEPENDVQTNHDVIVLISEFPLELEMTEEQMKVLNQLFEENFSEYKLIPREEVVIENLNYEFINEQVILLF